jgi:hypothetical protein
METTDVTAHRPLEGTRSSGVSLGLVLAALSALYVVSLVGLWRIDRVPPLPVTFVWFLIFVCLPIACSAVFLFALLQRSTKPGSLWSRGPLVASCLLVGTLTVYLADQRLLWIGLAVVLGWLTRRNVNLARLTRLVVAVATVTVGYGCVWNLNYLAAAFTANRLRDPLLVTLDAYVYGKILPAYAGFESLFPLTENGVAFRLLENAYAILFPQIMLVIMVLAATRSSTAIAHWIMVFFTAYFAGIIMFLAFPAVGPPIYAPSSFREAWHGTQTHDFMLAMATEFQQARAGGNLSGFGYFVAVPSLHAAAAVIVQWTLRDWRPLFWATLPATCLLILSTFVLGYHYLIDVAAGVALGSGLCVWLGRRALDSVQTADGSPMPSTGPKLFAPE